MNFFLSKCIPFTTTLITPFRNLQWPNRTELAFTTTKPNWHAMHWYYKSKSHQHDFPITLKLHRSDQTEKVIPKHLDCAISTLVWNTETNHFFKFWCISETSERTSLVVFNTGDAGVVVYLLKTCSKKPWVCKFIFFQFANESYLLFILLSGVIYVRNCQFLMCKSILF